MSDLTQADTQQTLRSILVHIGGDLRYAKNAALETMLENMVGSGAASLWFAKETAHNNALDAMVMQCREREAFGETPFDYAEIIAIAEALKK